MRREKRPVRQPQKWLPIGRRFSVELAHVAMGYVVAVFLLALFGVDRNCRWQSSGRPVPRQAGNALDDEE